MVSDALTTIKYYEYGLDPNNFKCDSTVNSGYPHLNHDNTILAHAPPSSSSTDFVYFHRSLVIWALTPAWITFQYSLGCMFDINIFNEDRDGVWNLIERKLTCLRITRNKILRMNPFVKVILILLAQPIILLISVLYVYIFSPVVIIVCATGNLHPRMDDVSLITFCKSLAKVAKFHEAAFEAIPQCALAMNFYIANKGHFECPEPFFPWINKGTVVIISMVFSIISITLSIFNFGNETLTFSYGKDWWKLWKRKDVLTQIFFWLLLSCFIIIILILIYILIVIIF